MTSRFPWFPALLFLLSVNLLAAAPIVIAPAPADGKPFGDGTLTPVGPQSAPAGAFDGERWFAAWTDGRYGNFDIFGTRVARNGEALDRAGIPISPTYAADRNPQVAWTSDHFLIVWSSEIGIFSARYDRDGVFLGSGLSVPPTEGPVTTGGRWMAWRGDSALVAWSWQRAGTAGELLVALLDRDGIMKTAPALLRNRRPASGVSIASDDSGFLVAWEESDFGTTELKTARVSAGGQVESVQSIASFPSRTFESNPAIAVSGSSRLLVWSDGDLRGIHLGSAGEPLGAPITIMDAPASKIGWASSDLIAVEGGWLAGVSGAAFGESPGGLVASFSSFLIRLGVDGQRTGLTEQPGTSEIRPRLTFSRGRPGEVLVLRERGWHVGGSVYKETLEPLRGPAPLFGIGLGLPPQTSPTLIPHGPSSFLVAWEENGWNISVLDEMGTILRGRMRPSGRPLLASRGDRALAVWTERDPTTFAPLRVIGLWISPLGVGTESFVIAEGYVVSSVATDGVDFVVLMREELPHPTGYGAADRLRSAVIRADGSVGISVPVAPSVYQWQADSVLAWTGEHYLAVWNERNLCVAGHCTSDLRAIRLDRSGFPTTADARFVTQTPSRENEVPRSLACNGTECAITWSVGFGDRISRLSEMGERLDGAVTEPGIVLPQLLAGASSVIWDGARWVVGIGAMAPLGAGEILRLTERVSIPLPLAHEGKITRLYVDRVFPGRRRAVQR
jgi:hypothetical protein